MKSNPNSLRASRRPLAIDAMYEEDFAMVEVILRLPDTPHNVLSTVYEYDYGQAKEKESVLSYACRRFVEGDISTIGHLFAMDTGNRFLSSITLSGINLRHLPIAIFHPNLLSLDVRDNDLTKYPHENPAEPKTLGWNCPKLETLNFSNNHFTFIHPDIFLHLPSLSRLMMSNNEIKEVPIQMWMSPHLSTLDLSNNLILELPCPPLVRRSSSMNIALFSGGFRTLPRRRRKSSMDGEACLPSLRKSCISYNSRSVQEHNINFTLEVLDLSGNHLSSVPCGLPCLAPLLKTLKLAKNRITSMGRVSDYPALLQILDLSENGLTRGFDPPPVNMANAMSCSQSQLEVNKSPSCFHFQHINLSCLKYLYLCQNRIDDLVLEYESEDHSNLVNTLSEFELLKNMEDPSPIVLFFPNLQGLRISKNSLTRFPLNIHKLTKLRELVVSHNEKITALPPLLHKLTSLFVFRFEGITDPIVPELAHLKNSSEILYYIKARQIK